MAGKVEGGKDAQRFREGPVSELVPHSLAFGDRDEEAALAEA